MPVFAPVMRATVELERAIRKDSQMTNRCNNINGADGADIVLNKGALVLFIYPYSRLLERNSSVRTTLAEF
jgi:hypothetical protein